MRARRYETGSEGKFASRWRAKSPDALCAVLPKIDLIEGHRVSVICNDGRVYKGFGAVPCIGEDENGEETDAVRLDLEPVFTSVYTCLFGKFCCILREKHLPGDSPPAYFCLVCNKIMLENPHIFLVKTGS